VAETELAEISLLQWSKLEDEGIRLRRRRRRRMWTVSEPF